MTIKADQKLGIFFFCPGCQKYYAADILYSGKVIRCHKCGSTIKIPTVEPANHTYPLNCPQCNLQYLVNSQSFGKVAICKKCQATVKIPLAYDKCITTDKDGKLRSNCSWVASNLRIYEIVNHCNCLDIREVLSNKANKDNSELPKSFKPICDLPLELARYLFKDKEAKYRPVQKNLNYDTEEDVKNYLGTYFPRTYIETYNIFGDLFSNEQIFSRLKYKNQLNILDIGAGTGANIIGLLDCLKTIGMLEKYFVIDTLDGSEVSIKYQRKLIDNYMVNNDIRYKLKTNLVHIKNSIQFEQSISDICSASLRKYDIIITSKFISELYNMNFHEFQNSCRKFICCVENSLEEDGLIYMVDVTTKDNQHEWFTMIMNRELGEYFHMAGCELKTVLPLCCAFWCENCKDYHRCYTQKYFSINIYDPVCAVKHNAHSKLNVRVAAKRKFAERILSAVNKAEFYQKCYQGNGEGQFCRLGRTTTQEDVKKAKDAFKLYDEDDDNVLEK